MKKIPLILLAAAFLVGWSFIYEFASDKLIETFPSLANTTFDQRITVNKPRYKPQNLYKLSHTNVHYTVYNGTVHFGGNRCKDRCEGHEAGYKWAMQQTGSNIYTPVKCVGKSKSFNEGCETFVKDQSYTIQNHAK